MGYDCRSVTSGSILGKGKGLTSIMKSPDRFWRLQNFCAVVNNCADFSLGRRPEREADHSLLFSNKGYRDTNSHAFKWQTGAVYFKFTI